MVNPELVGFLLSFISGNKKRKIDEVLQNRTRFLTVVLEDIYQSQNASAVVRSSDCFGIQDIHVIENKNKYRLNPDVTIGAGKWINIIRYNDPGTDNTVSCLKGLKEKGYRIIAMTPHKDDELLTDFEVNTKTALLFGTELNGLSDTALNMADGYLKVPMCGFSESLNISVSAAISIFTLTNRLRSSKMNWQLNEEEVLEQKYIWAKKIVKGSGLLEKEYLQRKKNEASK